MRVDNAYVKSNWGDWYLFDGNGRIVSGFANWAGSTYYFDTDTCLKHIGWLYLNGKSYYFSQSGRLTNSIVLNVAAISQFPTLPTGCEITDVAMLMRYRNLNISLTALANSLPYTNNPETGFKGNPFTNGGYTMYPPAWRSIFLNKFGSFSDLSGASVLKLKQTISYAKPVVAWVQMHGWSMHAILLTGFQNDTFIYNDPYTGQANCYISTTNFWKIASSQGHRAMTY